VEKDLLLNLIIMTEQEYSKFVWDNADQTQMYKDILNDLITD
jgi:hypothetical protein